MIFIGDRLGRSFQIIDDILDVIGDEKIVGKKTRKDRSHTILKVYAQNIQIKTGATYNYILALPGKSFVNFYNEDNVVIHSSIESGGRLFSLRFLGTI